MGCCNDDRPSRLNGISDAEGIPMLIPLLLNNMVVTMPVEDSRQCCGIKRHFGETQNKSLQSVLQKSKTGKHTKKRNFDNL